MMTLPSSGMPRPRSGGHKQESESRTTQAWPSRLDTALPAGSPKGQRIPALDFTKGTLVLLMVLYHWVNYFIGPQWPYYMYLRFLTPSFIFITGFMISNVYLSKYAAADSQLSKRLFVRGAKLLAVFLALNLARTLVVPILKTQTLAPNPLDAQNLFAVFVSGNLPVSSSKLVAFPILVPISYLLMFSGALMLPYRFYRYTFHLVCAVLLLCILMLKVAVGSTSYGLEFIAIGMLGLLAGFAAIETIHKCVRHPYLLALAYMGYAISINVWDVRFPLLAVGTALSLMVIYLVGDWSGASGKLGAEIRLLGQYSLFGYISQIAILQILSVGLWHIKSEPAVLLLSFVTAFVLTIVGVEVVDRARRRAASLDWLYKFVFA